MRAICLMLVAAVTCFSSTKVCDAARKKDPKVDRAVKRGLDYLKRTQHRKGYWQTSSGMYRIAMTALAGNALLCEGSTTTRGKYSRNIRRCVEFLISVADQNENGMIGYKGRYHYMYGHGFSMLFLSQVYGEEDDADRRKDLRRVLTKAVQFCGEAQTTKGGWGYVSAKDGNDFDEGSTCITQVQGLRACRNAGIPVPKTIIDRALKYIQNCTVKQGAQKGGVVYSFNNRGSGRPAITAAAMACLFNSGDYKSEYVKLLSAYCDKYVWPGSGGGVYSGHWHYTHYYYAQVMYRKGGLGDDKKAKAANEEKWNKYKQYVTKRILSSQSTNGAWIQNSSYGGVYTTSLNCTILQLDNAYLPIYQR